VKEYVNALSDPIDAVLRLVPDFPDLGLGKRANQMPVDSIAALVVLCARQVNLGEALLHLALCQIAGKCNPTNFTPLARWFVQEGAAVQVVIANTLPAIAFIGDAPSTPR